MATSPARSSRSTAAARSNAPTITSGPSGLVASTSASFAFSSGESGVAGFQCSLDGGGVRGLREPEVLQRPRPRRSLLPGACGRCARQPGPGGNAVVDGRHGRATRAGADGQARRPERIRDLDVHLDGRRGGRDVRVLDRERALRPVQLAIHVRGDRRHLEQRPAPVRRARDRRRREPLERDDLPAGRWTTASGSRSPGTRVTSCTRGSGVRSF